MSNRGRVDANNCFACGPDNPIGLRIHFELDDELCIGMFTPGSDHAGYDDMTHGGITFSALDDVMANWLFLRGARGYTARWEVRYRDPLRVGTPIRLEGRMQKKKGKLVVLEGKALRQADDSLVAECQASFVVVDPGPDGGF